MKHVTITLLVLLVSTATGLADGKLYVPSETVPLDIPYQRALILHQDGNETMVLQSRYEPSESAETLSDFGWVVPLPSVPELASMPAEEADQLFWRLSAESHPRVTEVGGIVVVILLFGVFAASSISLVLLLLSVFLPKGNFAKHRKALALTAFFGLYICFLVSLIGSSFGHAGMDAESYGVEVLRSEQVGIYDVKVIRSDSSAGLVAWLKDNGFQFTASDEPVVNQYIKQGWCFVAAKVRPGKDANIGTGEGGLMDPLVLRFKSENAVYPLALTSTIGVDTEVLLYVLSDRKMECGERMELLFAGDVDTEFLYRFYDYDEKNPKVFRPWEEKLRYLCKFKSTLTPEEMKTDLIFTQAKDNEEFRDHIIKW